MRGQIVLLQTRVLLVPGHKILWHAEPRPAARRQLPINRTEDGAKGYTGYANPA